MAEERDRQAETALVLSAGAPHSPLMAGALCALYEKNKTFDIIFTSGAGALIGLLFVAPKGKAPDEALKGLVELGVSDPIYHLLPIGYKAFFKPGPFTQPIHRLAQHFKLGTFPLAPIPEPITPVGRAYNAWVETWLKADNGAFKRLYNDLVDLWAAAITPTTLSYWSKGVCQPLPFLEDLVDFDKLQAFPGEFWVNAFSLEVASEARKTPRIPGRSGTGSGIKLFRKEEITPAHVRAAFGYPFIYPPARIDGKIYFEGADRDPISFGHLLRDVIKLIAHDGTPSAGGGRAKTIVLIDIVASLGEHLLREPRDLWDAFGISIITPVVAHAQKELARFERLLSRVPPEVRPEFLTLQFDIPKDLGPHITDWSYSNMSKMFEIGLAAGEKFLKEHGDKLPDRPQTAASGAGPSRP